ncbi:hypothetical protein FEM48_Zijuj06G0134100 [Ziziphus jujuba var. spinosa]|uniref:Uncharacterized protein n=1 Tax=Ziziphus jujuba var. spinosa TaxID=714518 RepID=A0A978V9J0_ZIZJJ|nr:hypothetical protein FEM48_Zijuj06G0134100 [Ziziphus jujuba var. spinosa]
MVRRFWWGAKEGSSHYLALKNWGSLCKPKAFRKFKDFNVALLAKLGWKLAKEEDCLWTRRFRALRLETAGPLTHGRIFGSRKLKEKSLKSKRE